MRIVAFVSADGFTKKQYDELRGIVNWEKNPAKGGVMHLATFDSRGIRVTDIWESEADFQDFVNQRLMPGLKKVGVTEPPHTEVYPLHAFFTPDMVKH